MLQHFYSIHCKASITFFLLSLLLAFCFFSFKNYGAGFMERHHDFIVLCPPERCRRRYASKRNQAEGRKGTFYCEFKCLRNVVVFRVALKILVWTNPLAFKLDEKIDSPSLLTFSRTSVINLKTSLQNCYIKQFIASYMMSCKRTVQITRGVIIFSK